MSFEGNSPSKIINSYFLHTSSTSNFLRFDAEQPDGLHPTGHELHLISPIVSGHPNMLTIRPSAFVYLRANSIVSAPY